MILKIDKDKISVYQEEPADKMINKMLDTTDLLEENFYAAHSRKSCTIKSIAHIKPSPSFVGSFKNSLHQEESKVDFYNEPTSIDSYKNNTFINHLPAAKLSMDSNQSSSNAQIMQNINNYKLITDLIEKHLQSSTNVFNQLMRKFSIYFVTKYEKINKNYQEKGSNKGDISAHINSAVADLQQFIRLLHEGINQFYQLDNLKMGEISPKENVFNRDNMINFITSLVFTDVVYKQIFELLRIDDLAIETALQKNLTFGCLKTPEEMGISPEFCLNRETLQYYYGDEETEFQNFLHSKQNNSPLEKRRIDKRGEDVFLLDIIEKDTSSNSRQQANSPVLQPYESAQVKKLLKEPFSDCIRTLKTIDLQRSPIHKMKTIVKTAELITISIQSFYNTFKIKKSFKLDSDQMLSIFVYIVAKSGIKTVPTHIKLIEKFTTNNVLNSISGYYATTLEACVNCIISMEPPDDKSRNSNEESHHNLKDDNLKDPNPAQEIKVEGSD